MKTFLFAIQFALTASVATFEAAGVYYAYVMWAEFTDPGPPDYRPVSGARFAPGHLLAR